MKKQTVAIIVGSYIAASAASWIYSKKWLNKFMKELEQNQIENNISKEEEA